MSEMESAPASVVSEPSSTADVAAQVIDAFDATETSGVESADAPAPESTVTESAASPEPAAPADAKSAPQIAQKPLTEAEKLLHDAGYKAAKKPDGRDNYIPHSKVVKIIENGINQGKGEFGQRYQALESEASELRSVVQQIRQAASGDPKAFIAELAANDPRYQVFLQPAPESRPQPAAPAELPAIDYSAPDGGVSQLAAYIAQQVESKLDGRIKPIEEQRQQAQQREAQMRMQETIHYQTSSMLEDAKTWPGFAEAEGDILAALQQDSADAMRNGTRPKMSLETAYRKVRLEALTTDRNRIREEILKEMGSAPRGTSVGRSAAEPTRQTANGASTASVASRVLDRLERG